MPRGCDIYVVTRGENHRRFAREMGAAGRAATAADLPVRPTAPSSSPRPANWSRGAGELGKGGTLSLADIYMTPDPAMDYQKHLFFERDIRSVTANTRADGGELLAEAARINLRAENHNLSPGRHQPALQDLKADKLTGTGVIVIVNNRRSGVA